MKIASCTHKQIQQFLSHPQHKGWGFPNYPGIRTNKKKRHAEATHNICPSKLTYRSRRRYIQRYIAHKCVTSFVMSHCVRGKQRLAASLRFAHATNLMATRWSGPLSQGETGLFSETDWALRGFEPPITVKRLAKMDVTKKSGVERRFCTSKVTGKIQIYN